MSGEISIYACGGTGTANAARFEQYRNKGPVDGFAKVIPYYIDTSMSDINDTLPKDFLHIFEGVDGSGKLRKENNEVIKQEINNILHRFRPADLSIIISSASGGSGAVIAGYLLNELLRRNHTVIVITVGTCDSRIELDNTIKTLKTYERAAVVNKTPVALAYWQNEATTPKEQINAQIEYLIRRLSSLFSRQHRRLDTTDLVNWLNYTKVCEIEPRLVYLATMSSTEMKTTDLDIISVATLCLDGEDSSPGIPVEYQAVGYVSPESNENIQLQEPINFCLVDGLVVNILKDLNKQVELFAEHRRAKTPTSRLVNNNEIEDSGDEVFL